MSSKPKVLCLHGYRQNDVKFKTQTGALRKILKNSVELFYISAPHTIPDSTNRSENKEDERGWWFTKEDDFNARHEVKTCHGFEDSVSLINKTFQDSGPFLGILGFSQGAAMASLICSLKDRGSFDQPFKFVLLISGFKSKCESHIYLYEKKLSLPSLHVFGKTDNIISCDMSEDLADSYINAERIQHDGGHFVPASSSFKKDYLSFIQPFLQ